MKWKFTHIHHPVRIAMGLTCNEYAVFDIYYKSQTHPDYTVDGWAKNSYKEIGDFLGMSKSTVFGIVERGVAWDLLEVNPAEPELKRTTPTWYNVAYIEDPEGMVKSGAIVNVRRSETERSETERQAVQKMNGTVRKPNANKVKKEVLLNINSTEELKAELAKSKIFTDSPENRLKAWNLYELYLESESFKNQWEFMGGHECPVSPNDLLKQFVLNADFFLIQQVRTNKLSGWIRTAKQNYKPEKATRNGQQTAIGGYHEANNSW